MTVDLEKIRFAIESAPGWLGVESVAVAFSGGLDSTVLLAALARLDFPVPVRALHIDHGLHADSARWSEHCQQVAEELGVGFASHEVTVQTGGAQSPEAAARDARYRALGEMLAGRELLLTAHHRDDQLETILLRLIRGTGVRGLRAIEPVSELYGMSLVRPLLDFSRDELRAMAEAWKLRWIEDPSNADSRFDRNYLRNEVIPLLEERWPGMATTAARAAEKMRAAQEILDDVAIVDAAGLETPYRVEFAVLQDLSPARRANLLRYLIRSVGLPGVTAAQLNEMLRAIQVARPDAETQVAWPGGEARAYRSALYLFKPMVSKSGAGYEGRLDRNSQWRGPEGSIELRPTSGAGLPDVWVRQGFTVRFRAGGERFRPLNDAHSRSLKKWLQVEGVVPWMRARIPLLYRDTTLVAVGDLVLSDTIREAQSDGPAWAVRWSDHPPLT